MLNFLITLILFSSFEVSSKKLTTFTNAFALTFYRFFLGLIMLIVYSYYKRLLNELKNFSYNKLIAFGLLGILNIGLSMSFLQLAVKYANAATAAVIFCSNPLFVFIISVLIKYEKFSFKNLFGVLIGITGIIFIMLEKGFYINKGAIFAFLSALLFSIFIILNKKFSANYEPVNINIVSFTSGLIFMLIFMIIFDISILPPPELYLSINNLLVMLFLGVVISGIGYITFINSIKIFSPIVVSLIFFLKPVISTLLAVVLINEVLTKYFYLGLVLVLIGSGIIIHSKYYLKE